MAERVRRKRQRRLEARIKAFEAMTSKDHEHEHHRPGSQSGRK